MVHEAWLKVGASGKSFADRTHFFRTAATAMRQILVDRARRKLSRRHGGGQSWETWVEDNIATAVPEAQLLAVDEALSELARKDPRAAEIVELRYFVGLTVPEVAEALDLEPRTVDRHWWDLGFVGSGMRHRPPPAIRALFYEGVPRHHELPMDYLAIYR